MLSSDAHLSTTWEGELRICTVADFKDSMVLKDTRAGKLNHLCSAITDNVPT